MRKQCSIILFLISITITFVQAGCGPSRPLVVDPEPSSGEKGGKRSSTSSSATAGSGERGRTTERTADGKPRLFSPIRTDVTDPVIVGQASPGGRIVGPGALLRARERVYVEEAPVRGNDFQQQWIESYGLLLMTVKLLEEMRSNLDCRCTSLAEARKRDDLVPAGFQVLTEAGIDTFNRLYDQWRLLHKLAYSLNMRFHLGTKELPAEPFFTVHQLKAPLQLTIQLSCESCDKTHFWDGTKRKLPMCCRQSLLVRVIQKLASQEDFNFETAQGLLTTILEGLKTMYPNLNKGLEKLRPETRFIQAMSTFLITMPKIE